MDIEEMIRKLTLMRDTITAEIYGLQSILQDINDIKGALESQEDDLK